MKLGLGTVQFGLDYGVSNRAGRPSGSEAGEIVRAAIADGARVIDTAPAYGESEAVLGSAVPAGAEVRIVTKTMPKSPIFSLPESLRRLKRERIYGCLVHQAADLRGKFGRERIDALEAAKIGGQIEKIGVSVYTENEIEEALEFFSPDIVQLPANVFDQRLLTSGHVAGLKRRGIEVHVRSIFLQGLLLMTTDGVPPSLARAGGALERFHAACAAAGCSPLAGALSFGLLNPLFDTVLVGVARLQEWNEIARAAKAPVSLDFERFALNDETVLNPSRWTRG